MKYAYRMITVVATVDDVKVVFEDPLIGRRRRHWGRELFFVDPIPVALFCLDSRRYPKIMYVPPTFTAVYASLLEREVTARAPLRVRCS